MSLALAIDYTLFIINRYREELSAGSPPEQALIRTMSTAGRTVAYSALTVALSLAAMAVFPMYFLRSLAYAGLTVHRRCVCSEHCWWRRPCWSFSAIASTPSTSESRCGACSVDLLPGHAL